MSSNKRKYWTKEDISFLKANYCSLTINEVADKLKRTYQQVVKKAHRIGMNRKMTTEYWTSEEDALVKEHFENAPKNKIMRLLPNRTWSAITQRGWHTWNLQRQTEDRYDIDYRFFETWNPESAYAFGFIASDGYVKLNRPPNNDNALQFELAEYDRDILEKIKSALKYEGPIAETKRNTVKLSINSRKICSDLVAKGIPSINKTFDMKWPETLPKELHSHFVRGLFDGDGSIYQRKNSFTFQLLGTRQLLQKLAEILPFESERQVRKREVEVCELAYSHRKAAAFGQWIYQDATIYLDRKFNKYQDFIKV